MRLHSLIRLSALLSRFDRPLRSGFRAVVEPRKPRHRIFRVLLALVGLVMLGVLLVAAVAIGAVMIVGGLAWRLTRRTPSVAKPDARVLDGTYRVVNRPLLTR